jgi:hypothetical protein
MLVCLAEEVKYTLELLNDLSLGVICAAQRVGTDHGEAATGMVQTWEVAG